MLALSGAVVSLGARAEAQVRLEVVGRSGGPRGNSLTRADQLGARDCNSAEVWSFRAELGEPASAAPSLWIGDDLACASASREPASGASCFQLCGAGSREVCASPLLAGATRYTVQVPSARIVDAVTGQCGAALGVRRLFLMVEGNVVARTSPITVDTVAPLPVGSPGALSDEGRATLSWDYAFDAGADAGADAGDVGDVEDAGVDAGFDAGFDAGGDVGAPTASREALRAVYVLCDPPRGREPASTGALDAATCGTGALTGIDPNDDTALAQYRCNDGDAGTGSPAVISGLRNGTPYQFGVIVEDQAGNRSAVALTTACSTPRSLTDYWERYRQQGGAAAPGLCDARPGLAGRGGLAWLSFGVGLVAILRRRRHG